MKKKLLVLVIMAASVLFIFGAYVLYYKLSDTVDVSQLSAQQSTTVSDNEGAEEFQKAPDFVMYDIDSNKFNLSDFEGKPVVLNFWASWCGPCKMEMPDFEEKYKEIGDTVNFLMVNMTDNSRETVKIASDFIASQGYTFPVYYDIESSAAIAYSVYSLPTTYFIDAKGNLVAQATGAIDMKTLQQGIDMITE